MSPGDMKDYKKTNSDAVSEFVSYYQTEISNNLTTICKLIRKVRENYKDTEALQEIKNTTYAIIDLAMVYGYEAIETIGYRMIQAFDSNKNNNVEDLLLLLHDATMAVEETMYLIDEKKERELTRDLSFCKSNPEKESNVTLESEENMSKDSDLPAFDIREDQKLMSLLSDAEGQAIEITRSDIKDEENDSVEINLNSVLSNDYSCLDFDIPKSSLEDEDDEVDNIFKDDNLEIDFKNSKFDQVGEGGILQKIGQFLGLKS